MKEQEQPKDRHLDTPAESNREKHINFLDTEAADANGGSGNDRGHADRDMPDEQVKKQWEDLRKENEEGQ